MSVDHTPKASTNISTESAVDKEAKSLGKAIHLGVAFQQQKDVEFKWRTPFQPFGELGRQLMVVDSLQNRGTLVY